MLISPGFWEKENLSLDIPSDLFRALRKLRKPGFRTLTMGGDSSFPANPQGYLSPHKRTNGDPMRYSRALFLDPGFTCG